ncbi:MAG: DNA repair protein RadA [Clostridia bacterium]|nr:DNA repair protein RadA [Clostridia bacterium]
MAKEKTCYACTSCGFETPRWVGRCPGCGAWNTMEENLVAAAKATPAKSAKQRPGTGATAMLLKDIPEDVVARTSTGIGELDRVLGGGIVEGGLMLIGGDPGVGKSTLLLQVCANLCRDGKKVLYVSGEESAKQIKLRARRLGIDVPNLYVLAENALDGVEEKLLKLAPDVAVVDSIQTMYRPEMASAPGSVSQIRECTSLLMRLCKESGTAIFLVGHVTKEGAIAGPRMLEHMVDVVLYFEGDRQQEYRLLRAVKNRFGSVNELGVFQMTAEGMQPVPNPSETLLSRRAKGASGSVVFCGMEGSRPLLCDVQALAAPSYFGSPRRTVGGADGGRVALLLAVLEKRCNQCTSNQDVYINVAGGLELSEPAADLALCVAVASSLKDMSVGQDVAIMGEIGLAGEVRAIPQCDRRIAECARLGFTTILLPRENMKRAAVPEGVKLVGVDTVLQALSVLF